MEQMMNRRREFLRHAAHLATGTGLQSLRTPFGAGVAALASLAAQGSRAADTSGPYKAIVCLFMNGGNDSHNWVVPTDTAGYGNYAAARRELAWPLTSLSPIACTTQAVGRTFGMPQELQPLRKWYESGQAAIVANVGPLLRPISKSDYLANSGLPSKLFSHNDQASTWQTLAPEGASSGWGGRIADPLKGSNGNAVFTTVSATGNAVFLSGTGVTQYQVGMDGPVAVTGLGSSSIFGSPAGSAVLQRTLAATGNSVLQSEYTRVMQRSISTGSILQSVLPGVSVPAIPPTGITLGTGERTTLDKEVLARQLRMVAQMIGAGQALGMRRQVFMVSMGGFDTHSNQMRDQPSLMSRVALSVDYFLTALNTMSLLDNVVLFSASDFGRTLLSNGSGSDHGWGSHHFVAGGMVRGRNIYGQFPTTTLGGPDDVGSGRLLPTTSVHQYAASLGSWMGLSSTELSSALPGLSNFPAAPLGFI